LVMGIRVKYLKYPPDWLIKFPTMLWTFWLFCPVKILDCTVDLVPIAAS
jgi:hypothetical protein